MFVLNDDNSIYATRGDIATINVSLTDGEGNPYTFAAGDVLRIKVFEKKNCSKVVLEKDFPVFEETDTVELFLDEKDTKIGDVISKPVDYWYEIELNPFSNPQTVIGYDEDGAKVFRLFPEGRDLEEHEYTEEEIPFMDNELDLTSTRPVENQAVARAIVKLKAAGDKTASVADAVESAVAIEKARIDNLIAHNVATLNQALGYLEGISEATKNKIDGSISSDGVFATLTINLREANLVYGGTAFSIFVIPNVCRPISTGLVHSEDGLEYRINFDSVKNIYYMALTATNDVAPSSAGIVTFTYALGDYELKDLRVDYKGVVYPTAGEAVREQMAKVAELTVIRGVNRYDNSKQTEETISPHYYALGVPHSTTQFDGAYNCTAPIEIEPNTQHTIALVGVVFESPKPWGEAVQAVFFYDRNMSFIGGTTDTTFITPQNARYMRFNYRTDLGLPALNEGCMLVEGDTVPTEYVQFNDVTLCSVYNQGEDTKAKVRRNEAEIKALSSAMEKVGSMSFAFGDDVCIIKSKYDDNEYLVIEIKRGGGNNLPDIKNVYITDKDDVKLRTLVLSGTDIFAPHVVSAINNADGDNFYSDGVYWGYFTGGNHQYNNQGSGSSATARCVSFSAKLIGNEVVVRWTNYIQGFNTTKADGSGREIMREDVRLTISGLTIYADVRHTALEDISRSRYYGLQMVNNDFDTIEFVGGDDRMIRPTRESATSGNDACRIVRLASNEGDTLEIKIDDVDLGDFAYCGNNPSAFGTDYGKTYFNVINGIALLQKANQVTTLRGYYKFYRDGA